jgi:hypothetical protein
MSLECSMPDIADRSRAGVVGRNSFRRVDLATIDYAGLVQLAAGAHPDYGYKRLARVLRSVGVPVSRTDVAQVLAHPHSRWKQAPANLRIVERQSARIRIKADAQRSRTPHATELCSSCGVRLSVIGSCRCSWEPW